LKKNCLVKRSHKELCAFSKDLPRAAATREAAAKKKYSRQFHQNRQRSHFSRLCNSIYLAAILWKKLLPFDLDVGAIQGDQGPML
jgi:hypothetical protein